MDSLVKGAAKLGLKLDTRQLEQFELYYREMTEWSGRVNLTSITGYEDIQVKHFLDALTAVLAWREPLDAERYVIDVGSGGGFPGIPLRIVLPGLRLVLLDSVRKKAAFLIHIKERLSLHDVEVIVGRAEEVARREQYRERFDVVLSRAVAPLPELVELALPFCRVGGWMVLHKKGDIRAELEKAGRAISLLGGKLAGVKKVVMEELGEERLLVVIDKVSPTPAGYPRRTGIPGKRPLS